MQEPFVVDGLEELLADGSVEEMFSAGSRTASSEHLMSLSEEPEAFIGVPSAPPEALTPFTECYPLHPSMFMDQELASWVTDAESSWLPNEIIERILRCSQLPEVQPAPMCLPLLTQDCA